MRVDETRFREIAETTLEWTKRARGPEAIERTVDAYAQFTTEVNMAQARYEIAGEYEHKSYQEVYESHYSQQAGMSDYLWGVYLTNFLWAHHMEIWRRFDIEFVSQLPRGAQLVEIAPGHGYWGTWALHHRSDLTLQGYDISSASIQIASQTAAAAGVSDRASYTECNALDLVKTPGDSADAAICCFLLEHLEEPGRLFSVIHHLLRPGGKAFVTGALTAAQVDHIYEFRRESELMRMAEDAGLHVSQTVSSKPKRTLPNAKFVPRSMMLLVTKPE